MVFYALFEESHMFSYANFWRENDNMCSDGLPNDLNFCLRLILVPNGENLLFCSYFIRIL